MFKNNERDGQSTEWNDEGYMIKNEVYREGQLVKLLGLTQQ